MELDADLRWVDQFVIDNNTVPATVPSYCEMDARLGWRPVKQLELSIVGQNLLHDRHPEYGAGPTTEEIVRGVYGKVAWRF